MYHIFCIDSSVEGHLGSFQLPRMTNKKPMEGVTEKKFGDDTEGKIIQRLPHLGIHTILNHHTQTISLMANRPSSATYAARNTSFGGTG